MSYTDYGVDARTEVVRGLQDSITYVPGDAGVSVSVDAGYGAIDDGYGFVTIRDPSGTILLPRTDCLVINNAELVFSYVFTEAQYPLAEDYSAEFEWQVSGVTKSDRVYFDVVNSRTRCPVNTSDLIELYPDIEKHLLSIVETNAIKFIRRGWSTMLHKIRAGGNRTSLILDKSRLVEPALHIAAYYMANALSRETDDIWAKRQDMHLRLYESGMAHLGEVKYDKNEDKLAGESETKRVNRKLFRV